MLFLQGVLIRICDGKFLGQFSGFPSGKPGDIFDMSGRHLWSRSENGVPTDNALIIDWDLRVSSGSQLHTGVYLYRVRIACDGSNYASKAKKMIVISNK